MVTPLLGWRADSRPCDCAQESEDCITACGERPQEWTEKKTGRVEGERVGERERGEEEGGWLMQQRERCERGHRGKGRGDSDDR